MTNGTSQSGQPFSAAASAAGYLFQCRYALLDALKRMVHEVYNFEAEKIAEIERRIKSTKADLATNASNIGPLEDKKAALEEELGALPSIEEKLKAFKGEGGEDSKKMDKAHELKALRDRDKRMVQGATELLDDVLRELADLIGRIRLSTQSLGEKDMMAGANAETLRHVLDGLRVWGGDVDKLLQEARSRIEKEQQELFAHVGKLDKTHKEQELKFRELIDKHKEAQGKATEQSRLEEVHDVSTKTAKRDLSDLVKHGLIEYVRKPHLGFYRRKA